MYDLIDVPFYGSGYPAVALVAWWDWNAEGSAQCGGDQCPQSDDAPQTFFFPLGTVNTQNITLAQ